MIYNFIVVFFTSLAAAKVEKKSIGRKKSKKN